MQPTKVGYVALFDTLALSTVLDATPPGFAPHTYQCRQLLSLHVKGPPTRAPVSWGRVGELRCTPPSRTGTPEEKGAPVFSFSCPLLLVGVAVRVLRGDSEDDPCRVVGRHRVDEFADRVRFLRRERV